MVPDCARDMAGEASLDRPERGDRAEAASQAATSSTCLLRGSSPSGPVRLCAELLLAWRSAAAWVGAGSVALCQAVHRISRGGSGGRAGAHVAACEVRRAAAEREKHMHGVHRP